MVKRYVESYTGFLNYCSNKLGKSVKDLVIEFRNNGVKRFTKAEKNN